jgi:hypothetical protein
LLLTADRAPNRVSLVDRKTTVLASPPVINVVGYRYLFHGASGGFALGQRNFNFPVLA